MNDYQSLTQQQGYQEQYVALSAAECERRKRHECALQIINTLGDDSDRSEATEALVKKAHEILGRRPKNHTP